MTKKIFRGILFSSIITMLACLVFTVGIQYRIYVDSRYAELESKAYIISLSVGEAELQKYSSVKERITLIDKGGTVLYDNKATAENMENHSQREEIKEALKDGQGYAVRRSETLGENTCYYALLL